MKNLITCGIFSLFLLLLGCKKNDTVTTVTTTDTTQSTPVKLTMVQVTGGIFIMGSAIGNADEIPLHTVTLSSYAMSQTEITQAQWKGVMGTNPTSFKNAGINAPQDALSWYDCVSFCNKLSSNESKTACYSINGNTSPADWTNGTIVCNFSANGYRLPTEAEWEFAATGGIKSKAYTYSGSNTIDNVAWYVDNAGNATHTTATKTPNELGFYDMSGNVAEWCWDRYAAYTGAAQSNPTGPNSGQLRITRGGSWGNHSVQCRSTARDAYDPNLKNDSYFGFRVVTLP